jgi:PleD family two-component response regulator
VLVADDDPVMRLLMLEMLAQVGLDAIEAEDGVQALACYKLQPDLVMLDVDMPAMDGFAVCREIRHQEAGGTVPIIMVTGGDELEAVTRAYEVGATDFVSKPINWPILGHRVLYVLRASDAISRLRIADAQHRAVLAAIPDTFFRMNRDGYYLDYEQGHDASACFSIANCVGSHIRDVLPPEIAGRLLDKARAVLATQHIGSVDYTLATATARATSRRAWWRQGRRSAGPGARHQRTQAHEEQIRRLAYCDSLTGIPNRQAFLETLERELLRSKARQEIRRAVHGPRCLQAHQRHAGPRRRRPPAQGRVRAPARNHPPQRPGAARRASDAGAAATWRAWAATNSRS